jgi:hypothetical protein
MKAAEQEGSGAGRAPVLARGLVPAPSRYRQPVTHPPSASDAGAALALPLWVVRWDVGGLAHVPWGPSSLHYIFSVRSLVRGGAVESEPANRYHFTSSCCHI